MPADINPYVSGGGGWGPLEKGRRNKSFILGAMKRLLPLIVIYRIPRISEVHPALVIGAHSIRGYCSCPASSCSSQVVPGEYLLRNIYIVYMF